MDNIGYDYAGDLQCRDVTPSGVCACCGEPITGGYYVGWYDGDPAAWICDDCIEDALDETWDELTINERAIMLEYRREI